MRILIYSYDFNGIRTEQKHGGVTTNYLNDHNMAYASVLMELQNNQPVATYTYGDDLISYHQGTGSQYYLYDALGSTRALTNSSGTITDTYHYDAYGTTTEHQGTSNNKYEYAGEQKDSTGSYYLRARYYNPSIGRFSQMDTYTGQNSNPVTLHKYLYANANPVMYTDPSGYMSLGSVSIAMNHSSNMTASILRAYQTYNKVETFLSLFSTVQELKNMKFDSEIKSAVRSNLKTFEGLDLDDAIDSLLGKSGTLLTYSMIEWDSYLIKNSGNINRFVIYLPQVPAISYREIRVHKIKSNSKNRIDLNLAFEPKGKGRLTGLSVGLEHQEQAAQIWRMDYHPRHEDANTHKKAGFFVDYPYHYHVNNAPN